MSLLIYDRYLLKDKIGQGSFGQVFSGLDKQTKNDIAIKLESEDTNKPHLKKESQIYKLLNKQKDLIGIANYYWYGCENGQNILVTEKLGQSLQQLFEKCHNSFSLKTVLMIAIQLIDRIETIHGSNIIHRDIKPSNFVIGLNDKKNLVYIIDFGLSKSNIDPITKKHLPFITGKSLVGTARYVSINTHLGIEQSKRDDLESLGYMFVYFLKGGLPWQNIKANDKNDRYNLIKKAKLDIKLSELCSGLPKEFKIYLKYVRDLSYIDTPNYRFLRNLFFKLMTDHNYDYDFKYSWI